MSPEQNEQARKLAQVFAKAWADSAFKARLIAEPAKVLKEHGVDVPAGAEIRVVENTEKVVHLTLPARPAKELSDEQLGRVAGGLPCDYCPKPWWA